MVHQKEGADQHEKRECLKDVKNTGKVYLLHSKNNGHMKDLIKLATKLSINPYAEYEQCKLVKKVKEITSMCSSSISRVVKIKDVNTFLRQ